jgi:hypothetical protein
MPRFKVTCDFSVTIERFVEAMDEDAALEEVVIDDDEPEIREAVEGASYSVEEVE